MKIAESSSKGLKTLWEMEKLLVTSNFSISHSVFKRLVPQTYKNQGFFWKGLLHNVGERNVYCWLENLEKYDPALNTLAFTHLCLQWPLVVWHLYPLNDPWLCVIYTLNDPWLCGIFTLNDPWLCGIFTLNDPWLCGIYTLNDPWLCGSVGTVSGLWSAGCNFNT